MAFHNARIGTPGFGGLNLPSLPNLEYPIVSKVETVVQLQTIQRVHLRQSQSAEVACSRFPIFVIGVSYLPISVVSAGVEVIQVIVVERYGFLDRQMEIFQRCPLV